MSPICIANAKKSAQEQGLTNTLFLPADGENTGFPSNSFDAIVCSGVLHHMDLSYVFPEIRRLLSPQGSCLAMEALGYNPAIQLYRNLTPSLRTDFEKHHILTLSEIKFAKRFFLVNDVKYWCLFTIPAAFFKRNYFLFKTVLSAGKALDSILLKLWPLKYLAWMMTFEMNKR